MTCTVYNLTATVHCVINLGSVVRMLQYEVCLSIEGIGHSQQSEGMIISVVPSNLWYSVIYVGGKERYVMVCKMYIDSILLLS